MLRRILTLASVAMFAACADQSGPGSLAAPPTLMGTRGVSQGGPQDIAQFRTIVAAGAVPSPSTLDATGFFAEHALDLPPATCGSAVCLNPMLAVAPRFNGGNWTMGFVALSTAVDPETLPRAPLHLVVAVTTSAAYSGLNRGLASVFAGLRADDRVSLIVPGEYPRLAVHGARPDDPRLTVVAPGAALEGALYETLAEASHAIESIEGFTGASRVILVTSGASSRFAADGARIVALGEAMVRRGVALSVIGAGRNYDATVPAALGSLGAGTYAYATSDTDMENILRAEGETRLTPLAVDFRLRVTAAPGYHIGRIYGVRRAKVDGGVAVLDAPALFIGSRMGARDVGGGRRGGGGGLFVELIADASVSVGRDMPAFRAEAVWRDPRDGAMAMSSTEARNALAPGQNPDGMWPAFSDEGRAKAFMMLNMYLALNASVRFYDDGDCARAQGVIDMMDTSVEVWNRRLPDPDLEADAQLLQSLRNNLATRCRATTPVLPITYSLGCFYS
jgi:Ca-activated chloride channel family protein